MAYTVAFYDGWTYWQAGSKPRAFKTHFNGDFVEFESWEEMAKELENFEIEHPWNIDKNNNTC